MINPSHMKDFSNCNDPASVGRPLILYFGSFRFPAGNAAALRALSISKSLVDLGYSVALYGYNPQLRIKDGVRRVESPIDHVELNESAYPRNGLEWALSILCCKREQDAISACSRTAIVIAYNLPSVSLYRLSRVCAKAHIRFVSDVTEWYDSSSRRFPLNIAIGVDTLARMRFVNPRMSRLICVSSNLYNYYAGAVPKCALIPTAVDTRESKWHCKPAYQVNPILTLAYGGDPGIPCTKERVDWLVQMICELNKEGNPCRLWLSGFDQLAFEKTYPAICRHQYYRTAVIHHGVLPHNECVSLIKRADLSAIVRQHNLVNTFGFPTKLSESFACGTPVISTPIPSALEYLTEGVTGFVSLDFSYDSIKTCFRKATSVPKETLRMMHSRVLADTRLDYRHYTNALQRIIE